MPTRSRKPAGFTLIEVLMVIAIIGVLVGLAVPAVLMGLRSVKKSRIALELSTLADAVEKYRDKYGDYPPDGASQAVFERHCRKIFPQIAASEFADVYFAVNNDQAPQPWPSSAGSDPRVMDPTEALVFFLGGLSSDPVHPFTGTGGPLQITARNSSGAATAAQYVITRNAPLFEFNEGQLTLDVVGGLTLSTDETLYGLTGAADAMPAYHTSGGLAPYVYFDSRTYAFGSYVNHFSPSGAVSGYARPYKSNAVNTSVSYSATTADQYYRYANEKTFQLISAGLDDNFGGVDPLSNPTLYYVFPTGQQIDTTVNPSTGTQTGPSRYIDVQGQPSGQLDNATNFSEGILEDGLPN